MHATLIFTQFEWIIKTYYHFNGQKVFFRLLNLFDLLHKSHCEYAHLALTS